MLKDEFQKEQWLKDSLDQDKVEIPKQLMILAQRTMY